MGQRVGPSPAASRGLGRLPIGGLHRPRRTAVATASPGPSDTLAVAAPCRQRAAFLQPPGTDSLAAGAERSVGLDREGMGWRLGRLGALSPAFNLPGMAGHPDHPLGFRGAGLGTRLRCDLPRPEPQRPGGAGRRRRLSGSPRTGSGSARAAGSGAFPGEATRRVSEAAPHAAEPGT